MLANADGSYTLTLSIDEIHEIETGFVPQRIQEEFAEAIEEEAAREDDETDEAALDHESNKDVLDEQFRRIAATHAFEAWAANVETDDIVYTNPWQHKNNEYYRVICLKDPDTSEPHEAIFTITFIAETDSVESATIEGVTYSAATLATWRAQIQN